MRGDILALLAYEAKRRPAIAELVANTDCLTEDEIRAARVPLPWMRQALLTLKRQHATIALTMSLESYLVDGTVADPMGEMRRWNSSDTFIKIGRSQLEICHGQLVWFGPTGVWIDTIHSTVIDPLLTQCTVSCGQITRLGYMDAIRARMRQLHPTVSQQQAPAAPYTIFRPSQT